jgi:hypothetical protein
MGAATTGGGVSVVIKTNGAGAGWVGVGGVDPVRLHPVKRNSPLIRTNINLLFIMVSSLYLSAIISLVNSAV